VCSGGGNPAGGATRGTSDVTNHAARIDSDQWTPAAPRARRRRREQRTGTGWEQFARGAGAGQGADGRVAASHRTHTCAGQRPAYGRKAGKQRDSRGQSAECSTASGRRTGQARDCSGETVIGAGEGARDAGADRGQRSQRQRRGCNGGSAGRCVTVGARG
jgi:hypothetical protein